MLDSYEKLALFYISVNPQISGPRQIFELAARLVRRIPGGEDRIKYDHLFDSGDVVRYEFYQKALSLDKDLSNSFIFIENDL